MSALTCSPQQPAARQPLSENSAGCVALVANTAWYLFNFRRNLIRRLLAEGFTVVAICPADEYVSRLETLGVRWVDWPLRRVSRNPIFEVRAIRSLYGIYRRERPLIVHHFTIKPILYGTVAARLARLRRVVNSVTGLGQVFVSQSLWARAIRPLIRFWYRLVLSTRGSAVMFQNRDDMTTLFPASSRLGQHAIFTPGSGVDLRRFAEPSRKSPRPRAANVPTVLFVGRVIAEKGIREFVAAAEQCGRNGVSARFVVCGDADSGNLSAIDARTIDHWKQLPNIDFLGHVDDIETQLQAADLVVLPSYREGMPRVLLEAGAAGKAVVASDVPGCRDVVVSGETGLLVPPRNVECLSSAITELIQDDARRLAMGATARQVMCERFDERIVLQATQETYSKLLGQRPLGTAEIVRTALPRGAFTLSLDFELAWGTRGRPRAADVPPFLDGTRNAIRQLLKLLEEYEIPATWVAVGALWMPAEDGVTKHPWLQTERLAEVPAGDCHTQPHWYAEDILADLTRCRVPQELGCHTLTHTYVKPGAAGRQELERELVQFLALFEQLGLPRPRSFIFPKASMAHFDLLAEQRFSAYRGPENKWFESLPGQLPRAALRLLDAKLAVAPRVLKPKRIHEKLWMIPASQFYSPFMSVGSRVTVADRVNKGLKGLHKAVRSRGVYHLWTHPFNLGCGTDQLLSGLQQIFAEAARLRDAGQLETLSMGDMTERLNRIPQRDLVKGG